MCGITGFIDFSRRAKRGFLLETVEKMATTLYHRGPNSAGAWADEAGGITLGFRRLAILDLSVEGDQPMKSGDGRFTLVFNGEIYNFLELREDLEKLGHRFRGHSDTEVMLAAFVEWGIKPTVKRLNGMFAVAVWDAATEEMTLIRDRIGKKPLYYGAFGNTLVFGSELKALRAHPDFRGEIDRESLALYLKFGYVPGPRSIYQNVKKLAPGCLLKIRTKQKEVGEQTVYWSLRQTAIDGTNNPLDGSEDEILAEFEILMRDSVKRRMLADVPLGAFLSGGTDSSIIVALMQAQSSKPVKTFTIGFHEVEYNEAEHAKRIAEYLKTDHHELYVTSRQALDVIPKLPTLYDEPFADSSQIPTFLVSQLASRHVTVSLSGDGGDEFFCGYGRYLLAARLWEKIRHVPNWLREPTAAAVAAASNGTLNFALRSQTEKGRRSGLGQKLAMLSDYMKADDDDALYLNLISLWQQPPVVKSNLNGVATGFDFGGLTNFNERMMLRDALVYLPDDILVKVDRASMGVSLEARAPLLDYRVVEFAWRVPFALKLKNGRAKWLLDKLLNKYVPREITDRPKMGFDVPVAGWLRGDLREWAEGLLDEARLRREGFLNPQAVSAKWQEHLSGKRNHQHALWAVLMFQAWFEETRLFAE
ncbi:MAG: asparagine synthase (glutamine-hydrolyzing) [Acidobacteria bacterium]|jgi:asparagine synthase (glutamine-hydrolysing)|nr:asparagine synthase (glutamine-hydrolyzing) [Acidobacteriota bacterium]